MNALYYHYRRAEHWVIQQGLQWPKGSEPHDWATWLLEKRVAEDSIALGLPLLSIRRAEELSEAIRLMGVSVQEATEGLVALTKLLEGAFEDYSACPVCNYKLCSHPENPNQGL